MHLLTPVPRLVMITRTDYLLKETSMKIKLHPPLDRIMGPIKEVPIEHARSLADLLRFLAEETPDLAPYSGFGPKDVQPYGLLVWRDGRMLTLKDILNPTDELEFIVMIAGG